MINLSRKVGDKEQRIVISGDSDFMSNEELTISRPGAETNNLNAISGSCRWLSGDLYPIDTSHIDEIDNDICLSGGWRFWVKLFFMGLLPLSLAVGGIIIIYRRQRK